MESAPNERTCLDRARVLMEQRRFALAEQELGRALEINPSSVDAHDLLAVCRSHAGDHRAAHRLARRAIELAPTRAESYTRHAWTLGADRTFLPPPASIRELISTTAHDRRIAAIMRLLLEALRLAPHDAYAWYLLSVTCLEGGAAGKAVAAAEKGLQFAPHDVELHEARARALQKLGRLDHALRATDAALAINPEHALSLQRRGTVLLHSGRPDEAVECLTDAVRRTPDDAHARQALADGLQDAHPIFRGAQRVVYRVANLGLLAPHVLVVWGLIVMVLGMTATLMLDPRGPAEKLLNCGVVFLALGLPLSLVWLRFAAQFVLTWHPRYRYLLSLEQRFAAHVIFYLWPALLTTWTLNALYLPHAVTTALGLCAVPLGAATAQEPGRTRAGFLIYAGVYTLAAIAMAIFGPGENDPWFPAMLSAGVLGLALPSVAVLTWVKYGRVIP